MTKEYAASTAKLAANQGLYNGFLAAGLIWSTISSNSQFSKELGMFFLSCVVVAGIYGGYSVNRRIFFIQALPALIVLFILLY